MPPTQVPLTQVPLTQVAHLGAFRSLAALGLTATPALGFLSLYFGKKVKKYQSHVQDLTAETATVATDILTNVRTVQSFGREALDQEM